MSIECNEDELVPPKWLDGAFFQKVAGSIEKCSGDPKICDLKISPASQKGDHYASVMFRAIFKYKCNNSTVKEQIVIIKTVPEQHSEKYRQLSGWHFFANEALIYSEVIPKFEAIWRHYGENIKFGGRALYSALQPHPVIVLEDLCLAGYDILRDRLLQLDEVKACLHKLACWHAVSHKVTLQQQRAVNRTPPVSAASAECERAARAAVVSLQHGLFTATNLMNSAYIHNGLRNMIAALEQAGGLEVYLTKLRALQPQLLERCLEMNNAYVAAGVEGPIHVLNHGDFHTRNLMVRQTADGRVEDAVFIDFQASFLGPSCCDLQYLSVTLFDRQLRDEKRDELFSFYFQCFVEGLRQIYLLATNLPLTALNPAKGCDVDIIGIFNEEKYRSFYYRNPDYIAYLRELLPILLD
ncbi:PREDICTED: uncharacterized protein LOC108361810 [Rhagoletis zephyria]|uniref:uncharacterized protein LOC108361810 n=1 Tax=Rhagoletis zephyria TaxID=28612 RepID=UPI00081141ED|nr:PREDICTED: uncharacterized protein LOC108361810 [Rhagoletis zephyria]